MKKPIHLKTFLSIGIILILIIIIYNFYENSKVFNSSLESKLKDLKFITTFSGKQLEDIINNTFDLVKTASIDSDIIQLFDKYYNNKKNNINDLKKLSIYNISSKCLAIYCMDIKGNCFISTDMKFIGKNYSFRPYFKKAIKDIPYIYTAIGVTSKKAGYYFSCPVKKNEKIIGIIVFKLDPNIISFPLITLKKLDFNFMVLDKNNVVIMCDLAKNIFHPIIELNETQKKSIEKERTFDISRFPSLNMKEINDKIAKNISFIYTNKEQTTLYSSYNISFNNWKLVLSLPQSKTFNLYQQIFNNRNFYLIFFMISIFLISYFIGRITYLKKDLEKYNNSLEKILTEKTRELEISNEKLLKSQKMDQIRLLASGMAHDFNNLITTIWGYVTFMKSKTDEKSPIFKHLNIVEKTVEKAAGLSREILDFGKEQKYQFKLCDLNRTLNSIIDDFKNTIPESINITYDCKLNNTVSNIDKLKIHRVILNILNNAKDVLEETGGIINIELTKNNVHNIISITDNGPGIPNNIVNKIFDPFFTTKVDGKGTGLGLAMSMEVIKSHNGSISVKSIVGQTTFSIFLPFVNK